MLSLAVLTLTPLLLRSPGTQGRSERFLGRWLRESGRVGRVTVATKVAGPAAMPWLRGGPLRLDGANLTAAVDGCLTRLGVECVDLLQIHWPDRCAIPGCLPISHPPL